MSKKSRTEQSTHNKAKKEQLRKHGRSEHGIDESYEHLASILPNRHGPTLEEDGPVYIQNFVAATKVRKKSPNKWRLPHISKRDFISLSLLEEVFCSDAVGNRVLGQQGRQAMGLEIQLYSQQANSLIPQLTTAGLTARAISKNHWMQVRDAIEWEARLYGWQRAHPLIDLLLLKQHNTAAILAANRLSKRQRKQLEAKVARYKGSISQAIAEVKRFVEYEKRRSGKVIEQEYEDVWTGFEDDDES